jgi:hypothetical protein
MGGAYRTYGRDENIYLVKKTERKVTFRIHKCNWEDYIKVDLTEIGLKGVDRIYSFQDSISWRALANTVMNILVP